MESEEKLVKALGLLIENTRISNDIIQSAFDGNQKMLSDLLYKINSIDLAKISAHIEADNETLEPLLDYLKSTQEQRRLIHEVVDRVTTSNKIDLIERDMPYAIAEVFIEAYKNFCNKKKYEVLWKIAKWVFMGVAGLLLGRIVMSMYDILNLLKAGIER